MKKSGSKRKASSSPAGRNDSSGSSSEESNEDGARQPPKSKIVKKDRRNKSDEKKSKVTRKRRDESSGGSGEEREKEEVEEVRVGRYWGDHKKEGSEEGEIRSSRDEDYVVGTRYYEKPEEKEKSVEPESDYLVGQRYYRDKTDTGGEKGDGDKKEEEAPPARKMKDDLLTRTGGAYIPPAKLRMMQANITDKTSVTYQRIAWEALKKSIHGYINKVNTANIGVVSRLLMKENVVRGRGLLCRSLLQAQAASPTFTNVYAALVTVVNSKFPNIGQLLMKRVILQFKRGFKRNDKALCISSCQFVAHLVNQQVAHEILALEILTLLLETPTDDSVEVAVAFLKEVGQKLTELSPKGTNAIFDMLRNVLHRGDLEKRVQYMIEVVFQVRKDGFASFPCVDESLDLIEEEDRYTHLITLDEAVDPEEMLNVFKHDPEYELNEDKYKALKEEILGESSSDEGSGEEGSDDSEDEDEEGGSEGEGETAKAGVTVIDQTETNSVALRRTIYLTIQSSLDFEECCHKLLKMNIKPGQEPELCHMLLDCCAELRTYEKFFGLLAQRFCQINRVYVAPLEEMFGGSYATVHRLDTNKLRNVARFFAHLLFTDAISWQVLETVKLNEEDTTSSSRIFIKILFQELAEYMGLTPLNQRLKDPTLQSAMEGLFPRDDPKNTRFAINFFTSIGLGGLTDELREHLKTQPKPSAVARLVEKLDLSSDESSSTSSSSDDSSSDDSDSSDSSDSETEKKNTSKSKKSKEKDGKKKKPETEKKNKQASISKNGEKVKSTKRKDINDRDDFHNEDKNSGYKERNSKVDRNKNEDKNRLKDKSDRQNDGKGRDKRNDERRRGDEDRINNDRAKEDKQRDKQRQNDDKQRDSQREDKGRGKHHNHFENRHRNNSDEYKKPGKEFKDNQEKLGEVKKKHKHRDDMVRKMTEGYNQDRTKDKENRKRGESGDEIEQQPAVAHRKRENCKKRNKERKERDICGFDEPQKTSDKYREPDKERRKECKNSDKRVKDSGGDVRQGEHRKHNDKDSDIGLRYDEYSKHSKNRERRLKASDGDDRQKEHRKYSEKDSDTEVRYEYSKKDRERNMREERVRVKQELDLSRERVSDKIKDTRHKEKSHRKH